MKQSSTLFSGLVTEPLPAGSTAILTKPVITRQPQGWRYSWDLRVHAPDSDVLIVGGAWMRSNQPIMPRTGLANAALAASMVPLMLLGLPVTVEAGVSPRLLRNLHLWQTCFASWYPELKRVPITAHAPEPTPSSPEKIPPQGEGVFFSLGVDSWYSVRSHLDAIAHLVYLDGFDLTSDQVGARAAMRDQITEAAEATGRPLIVVESNLRDWLDRRADWKVTHGCFLGAATLLLEGQLHTMWQGSSSPVHKPESYGSNGITDPLFSTENVRTVYDGGHMRRFHKLMDLLDWPLAMGRLRVCWSGTAGLRNCGECPKCLRTMLVIHLLADPAMAPLFPPEINFPALAKLPPSFPTTFTLRQLAANSRKLGFEDHPVTRAVDAWLERAEGTLLMEPNGPLSRFTEQQWAHLAGTNRETLANDLMEHAPDLVVRTLTPAAPRVTRELLATMWTKDRNWLLREAEKRRS